MGGDCVDDYLQANLYGVLEGWGLWSIDYTPVLFLSLPKRYRDVQMGVFHPMDQRNPRILLFFSVLGAGVLGQVYRTK